MKLFLHAGTEKTGSSHIQTLCVNGREHLQAAGIWFPEGIPRHERRMRAGLVSAGNAFVIAERARDKDDAGGLSELLRHRKAAQFRNCRAVFLSSELLLPYCANDDAWSGLFENCRRAGFESVSTLLILREPVDQLISLYKHRAKGGTAGDLDQWCESGYQVPQELAGFLRQVDGSDVELTVRRYERSPGAIDRIFFDDWLGIPPPRVELPAAVNPSLTLPELVLIRKMAERKPEMVEPLYSTLIEVPSEQKARGRKLEAYARTIASRTVADHAEEWAAWNKRLPKDEPLTIPNVPETTPDRPNELELSERQMEAISELLGKAATPGFIARMAWRSRVRPMLGRLKRAVIRVKG